MKNILTICLLSVMLANFAAAIVFTPAAEAETIKEQNDENLGKINEQSYQTDSDPNALTKTIGNIIKIILGFLGVILIVIVIYAGFLWMTAGGEADQTKKARDWLTNAIIGLAIILSAYAITDFVMSKVMSATLGQ